MPTNVELARTIATNLGVSSSLEDEVRTLLTAIGPITQAVWYDVGPGGKQLVVLPGWSTLASPLLYVHVATRGT